MALPCAQARTAEAMIFRLLGPFTIEGDGRPVVLRGNRSRAVLALLLLNAGTLVQTERIIDAVWGYRPPRTVRTQVQAQISEIRSRLRGTGSLEIDTHQRGYLLHVDPAELDVTVFGDLVRQSRSLRIRSQPMAAELLRSAIALHTGPPLGDVDAPFAGSEADLLAEGLFTAIDELIGLDLQLGRHRELIPQLNALVAQYPLRESLWHHLVVALQRSDRRSDAITCYRRVRAALRAELGVEPGRELTAVYRTLLRDDPEGRRGDDHMPPVRVLARLEEVERLLHDIRRQLESSRSLGEEPAGQF